MTAARAGSAAPPGRDATVTPAGAAGGHPVLGHVAEAARLLAGAAEFLSRIRGLEAPGPAGWPADLGDEQTAELLVLLSALTGDVSRCVREIGPGHASRAAGNRDLHGPAGVLSSASAYLRAAAGQSRARPPAGVASPAALAFPAPATPAPPARRRTAGPPTALLRSPTVNRPTE